MDRIRMSAAPAALVALLLAAPIALADTCCGSATVTFDPPSAAVGDTVGLDGLQCRSADEGPAMSLEALTGFWLTTQSRAAFLDDPARPDPAEWLPFASVADPAAVRGSATIVVPDLPDGRYYLWWACGEGDPVSHVLQWSTGPRLVVGSPPSDCPAVPATFDELLALGTSQPMSDVVTCLGDSPITFIAYSAAPWGVGGPATGIEPAWLGEPLDAAVALKASEDRDASPYFVAIPPGSGLSLPDGQWVRVTGHFDDPAAQTCTGGFPPTDPAFQDPVQFCRERLVLTAVAPVTTPPTSTGPAAAPASGPGRSDAGIADLAILLGAGLAALATIGRLARVRAVD